MPDPLRSFEEWDQRHHRDIEGRAHSELVVERNRLRSRLRLDACPDPWLFERLSALEEGMRRAR